MAEVTIWYEGGLATRAVHENGAVLITYPPGDMSAFSPTDLVGVALGSCVLTLMGIAAKKHGVDLKGTKVVMEKSMHASPPRRIDKIRLRVQCPRVFSEEVREALVKAAETCPVSYSLHPDIVKEFVYEWGSP